MRAKKAQLFQNGGSQAVRLPRAFRFPPGQTEVLICRDGGRIILEPADEWSAEFRACLGGWPAPIARPKQRPIRQLRDPFG